METAQNDFAPETCHQRLLDTLEPALAYAPERDYQAWLQAVDARLRELLGPTPSVVPLNIRQEEATERDFYRETRFVFTSEPGADVPCHLLTPLNATEPLPLIICLQGHTSGMHISLGRPKSEGDERMIAEGDRDFALQAVREGYAALVMEQRCFGERRDARAGEARHVAPGCHHASMTALLLGRTMIGERVWDVRRAIDALAHFAEIDTHRIGCMGNSGGGTITWFAACVEPRLQIAMPSCYVCSFQHSLARIDHCADNYLPGILRWFDLGDLACLIAPRPLVVVAGQSDPIFPLEGVQQAFATIQQIYARAGAPENCRLVIGNGGHRFYAAQSWPVFNEFAAALRADPSASCL